MLEPVDNTNLGQAMMTVTTGSGPKRTNRGQHRAQDGKFESGYSASRKGNYNAFSDIGGAKGHHESVGGGRKTGGRKKAGGDVGRAFYDSALPASQEPALS